MPWEARENELEELRKQLVDEAGKEDRQFQAVCEDAVRELLSKIMEKDLVDANVRYYLTGEGSETCSRMVENDPAHEEEVLRAVAAIHAVYVRSELAFDTSYLFLNAPWEGPKRNLAEDELANKVQNEQAYSKWNPSEEEKAKNPKDDLVVQSRADIAKGLDMVFRKGLMKTRRITIVYNGEGYGGEAHPKGSLYLHKESETPLPVAEFLDMVQQSWERAVRCEALQTVKPTERSDPQPDTDMDIDDPESNSMYNNLHPEDDLPYHEILDKIPPLPSHVKVILAQCHGYNGTRPPVISRWKSCFEQTPLTDPSFNKGKAMCTYKFDCPVKIPNFTRMLIKTNHPDLEFFAQYNRRRCSKGKLSE